MEKEELVQKRLQSLILKNVKDYFSDLFEKYFKKTLSVKVENQDTNLHKEVAKNTRGVKERIDKLINKEVSLSKIEETLQQIRDKEVGKDRTITGRVQAEVLNFPEFPKSFEVSNFPLSTTAFEITNFDDIKFPKAEKQEKVDISPLVKGFSDLKTGLKKINDLLPGLKPNEFPEFKFPKQFSMKEGDDIKKAVKKMEETISDDLVALSKVIKEIEVGGSGGSSGKVEVTNFPPQHIPTPVTNININSLRGVPLSTVVTVGTTAVPLPATALSQRRSLLVFNNSGSPIFIGGADVTVANGMPVMDQGYSPPIDAGQYMKVYAIAETNGNEVRVLEISNDAEGN